MEAFQDLEEFNPEEKLKNDEEQGINIETMSLSGGDDSDIELDDLEINDETVKQDLDEEPQQNVNKEEEDEQMVIQNDNTNMYSSESDDDDDLDYDESMKKIEQDINKDILFEYHPETKQINYKELLTLSNVVRNKKGHIIDPLHKTVPFLTSYEKAKILGMRAKQINNGSTPFVDVPKNIMDGHTIALMELNKQKIPFIIRRPIPNGGSEYWKVSDLKVLE